jgi:DNA-directed RNA polymerase sigma subunit (sigma70/sigma32)
MRVTAKSTPDFDVTVKLRNNHLVAYREGFGWTAPEFAERMGVSYATYILFESMKTNPVNTRGEWRPAALKIAEFMGSSPDEIWPEVIQMVQNSSVNLKVTKEQIAAVFPQLVPELALPPHPDEYVENDQMEDIVRASVTELRPTAQRILVKKFGLDGNDPKTLPEIAEEMGQPLGTIRWIYARTLRKLRHSGNRLRSLRGEGWLS